MATGYERIIGFNTPDFFLKDSFATTPLAAGQRRVVMQRAIPGVGRFPTVTQLDESTGHDAMRLVTLTGVATISDVKSFD